ncbi:translation elongation factor Ts [candidate division WWE3 bacterium]|jgi:elongation factor Ts|uniref:Elongation factor Ts n=1 Tax=candidate division WWE3 bacterium TaxID=2053526 RepID=A0A3A4ZNC9_UNCKA|nr:MAG: translation elongation factor Ts [candidate division WWE3 bacterium]
MSFNINDIKKLREETGAGVLEVKQALENAEGDYEKAKAELMKKVAAKAAKKADRVTKDGLVESYIHAGGKVGSLVTLACETDFVAKTDDFKKLAHEVAMQVCTEEFENVDELLNSEYIRDPGKKIKDLIDEVVAKVGEKVEIREFTKFNVRA